MNVMSRRRLPAVLLAIVLLGIPMLSATAQTSRQTPLQQATRALIDGKYDEVDMLTNALDLRDPDVAAVKARAAIDRGRYGAAEALLRPVADRLPTSAAALELGLLQQMLGRPDATAILTKVAAVANAMRIPPADVARAARALRALGQLRDSNDLYRIAATAAPADAAVNTGWGELFLATYNRPEALKSFTAVLKADARWTPALMGAAEALADDDPPQAVAAAKRALDVNASSVDAMVFLAKQSLDADRRADAKQLLQRALAVNPSSLAALSQVAAIAYVEDKTSEFDTAVAKVLAIAPNYGEVYRATAEFAAHNYRFDEAVALTRRGLAIDADNARALASLGAHLMRTGDEPGARTALEASFKIDPYDVVTFNLLGNLDTVEKFATVRDGELVIRMNAADMPVMHEPIVALAHQALNTLAARYEFTPKGPILIEMFNKHDDFAVRNVGLPGMIGALGACFGRVVTIDSPKALAPGSEQWEGTLWHELAHVITIQMSNQRVPRWLTEGISVFEEKRARPEWARPGDMDFAAMLERGETIKLRDLNAAFTDPEKISLAYYQGSLVVEYLVQKYGDEGLRKLLRTYAQGLDTDAALKAALNTSFTEMQAGFDQAMDRQFGNLRKAAAPLPDGLDLDALTLAGLRPVVASHPQSYAAQMALGAALRKALQFDEAMQVFERAAALVPIAPGPHAQMAAIALARKDKTRAIAELQAQMNVDFDNVAAARELAAEMREANISDPARLMPVYARIVAIDPFDIEAHTNLGRSALQGNAFETASREFRAVIALAPVDRATALTDLAESYVKAGKRAEARTQILAALEIAPTYERAQSLLLTIVNAK